MTSNQTQPDDGATESSFDAGAGDPPAGGGATVVAGSDDVTETGTDRETDDTTTEDDAAGPPASDVEDQDDVDDGEDRDDGDDGDDGEGHASPADLDESEDDEEGPSRVVLLVGAAVAFVAIAIVGILIASGGGDSGGGGNGNDDAAPADARTDVGIFGTIDQFDRPDSPTSLGDFAPGRPWAPDAGTWGIDAGEAYLSQGDEFRNHAVVGLGQGDGGAQVRLDTVVNGAGLVFRYVGPYNYWAVVAVPDVATWNVIKVVDGDQEVVGNTGQSPTADGTTVGVRLRGDTIEVIINGRIRKTVVDDFQVNAGKVGITVRGPDSGTARFDDFVAGLPGGVPLTGGAAGNGGNGARGSSTTTAAP